MIEADGGENLIHHLKRALEVVQKKIVEARAEDREIYNEHIGRLRVMEELLKEQIPDEDSRRTTRAAG